MARKKSTAQEYLERLEARVRVLKRLQQQARMAKNIYEEPGRGRFNVNIVYPKKRRRKKSKPRHIHF